MDRSHRALRRIRDAHKRDRVQPCWRCGQPINYEADPKRDPDAYTLGHVAAVATGGSLLDLSNLAPEHRRCNLAAGTRNGIENGEPSRQW